jgi:hypothetical protein
MAAFETRITYSKLSFSPIATEDMAAIGGIVLDHMKARIQAHVDWDDNPARPLKPSYAQEKVKGRRVALTGGQLFRGQPFRDWTLRGRTMQSLKVKSVSQDQVTIGPVSEEASKIINARNPLDHMWAMSPSDTEVLHEAVYNTIMQTVRVRLQPTGEVRMVA